MSDADRLEELRRQRAKLEEELARLEGRAPVPVPDPVPVPKKPVGAPGGPLRPTPVTAETAADALFDKLRVEEKLVPPSKAGCWMSFTVIMVVLIAAVATTMWILYR